MHVTKHRTIDPACLENPRPEGAESGEHRFAIFVSSPNTFFQKVEGYSGLHLHRQVSYPTVTTGKLVENPKEEPKECEKVPEIFVRKSTVKIVTRYTRVHCLQPQLCPAQSGRHRRDSSARGPPGLRARRSPGRQNSHRHYGRYGDIVLHLAISLKIGFLAHHRGDFAELALDS